MLQVLSSSTWIKKPNNHFISKTSSEWSFLLGPNEAIRFGFSKEDKWIFISLFSGSARRQDAYLDQGGKRASQVKWRFAVFLYRLPDTWYTFTCFEPHFSRFQEEKTTTTKKKPIIWRSVLKRSYSPCTHTQRMNGWIHSSIHQSIHQSNFWGVIQWVWFFSIFKLNRATKQMDFTKLAGTHTSTCIPSHIHNLWRASTHVHTHTYSTYNYINLQTLENVRNCLEKITIFQIPRGIACKQIIYIWYACFCRHLWATLCMYACEYELVYLCLPMHACQSLIYHYWSSL